MVRVSLCPFLPARILLIQLKFSSLSVCMSMCVRALIALLDLCLLFGCEGSSSGGPVSIARRNTHNYELRAFCVETGATSYVSGARVLLPSARADDFKVNFTDGSNVTYGRRERPQVLFIDGEPAVLYNGVDDVSGFGWVHTLAQRIATTKEA